MAKKIITIVGVTGNQGASVAEAFLKEGGWHVRGITRDASKASSKIWADQGVELVEANLDDAASLKTAFAGSAVIFGVTDFWAQVTNPENHKLAQTSGRAVNLVAKDCEVRQGRNIVDAANATIDTLDLFILSTLSHTSKWSKGKYTNNHHFDGKWEAAEYLKATYPALAEKSSYLQVGLYMTNWKGSPAGKPTKEADGSYVFRLPTDGDAPIPMVEARRDTGNFALALTKVKAGQNLLGFGSLMSWNEFVVIWGKVHGVTCRFERLPRKVLEDMIPGGLGTEIADMFEYMSDFGYDGGDPSVIHPKDLGVECPTYSVEQYIKDEDWSSCFES